MTGKRPHDDNGPSSDIKRSRSNNGSPAPQDGTSSSSTPASIQAMIAAAKAKAAAARERLQGMGKSGSGVESASYQPPPPPPPPPPSSTGSAVGMSPLEAARAKVEAAKARMAAARENQGAAPPQRPPATSSQGYRPSPLEREDRHEEGNARSQRGGLGVGLHPMLMGNSGAPDKTRSIGTKFGTTIGNKRQDSPATASAANKYDSSGLSIEDVKANPYFDQSLGTATVAPKERRARQLVFHEKGKFIAQAAALRRQAQLEQMKRDIAAKARKAGLEEDRSEKAFLVDAARTPTVEWWDQGLLAPSKGIGEDGQETEVYEYPNFENDDDMAVQAVVKIDTEDSVITRYIQHPVQVEAPQEKLLVEVKPMYLTKEERKKKRRQNRAEILQEKQAKVRLGLEPPEPPKVKKSNIMRVMGEQAVKDPTAVEARVNREIADRREKHETANEERKLTTEQRLEKIAANQEKDKAKGLAMCVFRIDNLAFGKHRFKIDIEAKKNNMTGLTILNPKMNLVVIEGGHWAINKYKKLMLQRIDWTENGFSTSQSAEAPNHRRDEAAAEQTWLKPEDDEGRLKDMSGNRCVLVWEGEEMQQAFRYWTSRICETDSEARRALERHKMENMWQLAKAYIG